MMRLSALFLIPLLLASAQAEDFSSCFIPGEVSEYKVSWMGIPLAWSKNTTEIFEENGRQLIRIRTVSKSYKAYAPVYKVDDLKEVIIDPETALPIRIDVQLNEGSISKSNLTLFDHANRTALFIDRMAGTTNQTEITSQTRDVITFLYAMRNKTLKEVSDRSHTLFSGGKLYELAIKIGKDKRIKLPGYGKVDCIQIEPIAEFDGLFLRKGKISFLISKQNFPMITCIKAKVPVGKITIKLQQVSDTGDPFWDNNK